MKRCRICGKENPREAKYCINCGTAIEEEMIYELKVGKTLGSKYRIGKVIGKGGFGITYKGSDEKLKRVVAIKEYFQEGSIRRGNTVVPPHTMTRKKYEESKERYLQEARLLAQIRSENIVKIYEYIEENDTGYIIMEYLQGKTLREIIEEKGKMKEEEIKEITGQIIKGMKEVHEKGILHRDIKPENIMIEEGKVKVLDFGAAREYVLGQSREMSQIITEGYAPPEQYAGRGKYGPEVDIYAIGASMYEMATGKKPANAIERMYGKGETEKRIEEEKISEGMKSTISKCLEIKAENRYKKLEELEKELEENGTLNHIREKKEQGNKKTLEMVLVEKGKFIMGSDKGFNDEKPMHEVELTYNYWMEKYPVTFEDYDRYSEETGKSKAKGEGWGRGKRPVINVSWYDAIRYCNWLSEKEGIAKAYDDKGNLLDKNGNKTTDITKVKGYRLPTEAEWEHAARGGQESRKDYKYAGSDNIDEVGWYDSNSGSETKEVGKKKANELGIYDMSGNVREMCSDNWYSYTSDSQINPYFRKGLNTSSSYRVKRGGSWYDFAKSCRVADRGDWNGGDGDSDSDRNLGFRVARTCDL